MIVPQDVIALGSESAVIEAQILTGKIAHQTKTKSKTNNHFTPVQNQPCLRDAALFCLEIATRQNKFKVTNALVQSNVGITMKK